MARPSRPDSSPRPASNSRSWDPTAADSSTPVPGANLFTGGRISLAAGPVAVVSQSGFLLRSCLAAGQQRQLGFGVAVSSGNEAVCDLAAYLEYLADDPATTVVCLVIEKIRDADAFLGAVARVRSAGKAIVALKLGRTERSPRHHAVPHRRHRRRELGL